MSRVFSHVSHAHSRLSPNLSYKLVQRCVTRYLCLVFADVFLMVRFDVQSVLIFEFCMVYAPRGCLVRRIFVKFASFDVHWQIWSRFFLHFASPHANPAAIFVIYGLDLVKIKTFDSCGTPRTAAVFRFCSSYFSRRGTRTPRAPHFDDNVCASSSSLAFQVLLFQVTMPWRILKGTTGPCLRAIWSIVEVAAKQLKFTSWYPDWVYRLDRHPASTNKLSSCLSSWGLSPPLLKWNDGLLVSLAKR